MIQPDYKLRLTWDDTQNMDRPHFHEDIEILLSLSSAGDFFAGGELYPLRRGSLFLIGEATLHRCVVSNPYNRYILHVSPKTLRMLSTRQSDFAASSEIAAGRFRLLNDETTDELAEMLRQLDRPCDNAFGGDLKNTVLLIDILIKVFSMFDTAQPERGRSSRNLEDVAPIMSYIQEHLTQPLTLDALSSALFINKYHMSHIFKAATGFSIMEYIINCRILRARELLREGVRVQDAGELVGFQNNAHFIRTFGRLTGTSPKRYAKEYLAGNKT